MGFRTVRANACTRAFVFLALTSCASSVKEVPSILPIPDSPDAETVVAPVAGAIFLSDPPKDGSDGESSEGSDGSEASGSNSTRVSEGTERALERFGRSGDREVREPPRRPPRPAPMYKGKPVPAPLAAKFNKAIREYYRITKNVVKINSGVRTPATQAEAMHTAFALGKTSGVYRDTREFRAVLKAYQDSIAKGETPKTTIEKMTDVIAQQVKEGRNISLHFSGHAMDFNVLSVKDYNLFRGLMQGQGFKVEIHTTPLHIHVEIPPSSPRFVFNKTDTLAINKAAPQSRDMTCLVTGSGSARALELTFQGAHGGELVIVDPKDVYWFVAFAPLGKGLPAPPITAAKLSPLKTLKLDVTSTRGVTWIGKIIGPQPIFAWNGRYAILVGKELGSDAPEVDAWCEIDVVR